MVVLKWWLDSIVWSAVLALVLLGVSLGMNTHVPDWLETSVTLAVLSQWIVHIIRSDKKATERANRAALEHRIKNA